MAELRSQLHIDCENRACVQGVAEDEQYQATRMKKMEQTTAYDRQLAHRSCAAGRNKLAS